MTLNLHNVARRERREKLGREGGMTKKEKGSCSRRKGGHSREETTKKETKYPKWKERKIVTQK